MRTGGWVISIGDHDVVARDIDTGGIVWHADRGAVTGPPMLRVHRQRMLIGAEGVQSIDLATGTGWSPMPASRRDFFVVAGDNGVVNATTIGSLLGGKQVRSMSSPPLVAGDRLYFAAETSVVCLELESGRCLWRRDLTRAHGFSFRERAVGLPPTSEFLGRLSVDDAGENVTVTSLGWAPGKNNDWRADPPTIAVIAKADGRVVRRVRVEGTPAVIDVRNTPHRHYVLGADRVIVMDDSLAVLRVLEPRADLFEPIQFFPCRDPILIARAGVAAIDPDSLGFAWHRKAGIRDTWSDSFEPWIDDPSDFQLVSVSDTTAYRWAASTSGLLRFDPREGCRPDASYPLTGLSSASIQNRTVLAIAGRMVTVLPLPERRIE
jgi:hypothetical protein